MNTKNKKLFLELHIRLSNNEQIFEKIKVMVGDWEVNNGEAIVQIRKCGQDEMDYSHDKHLFTKVFSNAKFYYNNSDGTIPVDLVERKDNKVIFRPIIK